MCMLNKEEQENTEIIESVILDEQTEPETKSNSKKQNSFDKIFDRALLIFAALFAITSIFFAQICVVAGDSMLPNLHDSDVLVIEKITDNYERMDVVVINWNKQKLIKRIVALPGEKIKIENDKIYINGEEITDIVNVSMGYTGIAAEEITLGDNEYFVLGDNRENSLDSRDESVGVIKKENIVGKEIWVFHLK